MPDSIDLKRVCTEDVLVFTVARHISSLSANCRRAAVECSGDEGSKGSAAEALPVLKAGLRKLV